MVEAIPDEDPLFKKDPRRAGAFRDHGREDASQPLTLPFSRGMAVCVALGTKFIGDLGGDERRIITVPIQ